MFMAVCCENREMTLMGCLRVVVLILMLDGLRQSSALMGNTTPPTYNLVHDLLDGYNPLICPKNGSNGPIEVTVGYSLMSMYHVDEKAQTITVNGWLELRWTDHLLRWDPTRYNNIDMVVIQGTDIWLPDISFENGVDKLFLDFSNIVATVYANGTVSFPPGGPVVLFCTFDLSNFPFDVQICKLQLSPWTTPERVMQYKVGSFHSNLIVQNGEWTILDVSQRYNSYPSDQETYSEMILSMLIQRRPMFQVMNSVLPVIMLAFLNLAVFRLPPDSGEKVSLSITVLLAYSVWLLTMSSIMPSASQNIPFLGIFITILMGISTLSVIVTVLIVQIHSRDDSQPIPTWLKKVLGSRRKVKQLESTAEKISWKTVASAADLAAFYILLAVTILLMLIAVGRIGSNIATQPSSLQ